jgi:hypothetical protein
VWDLSKVDKPMQAVEELQCYLARASPGQNYKSVSENEA